MNRRHCSCQLLAPPVKREGSRCANPPSVGLVPVRRPQLAATKSDPALNLPHADFREQRKKQLARVDEELLGWLTGASDVL